MIDTTKGSQEQVTCPSDRHLKTAIYVRLTGVGADMVAIASSGNVLVQMVSDDYRVSAPQQLHLAEWRASLNLSLNQTLPNLLRPFYNLDLLQPFCIASVEMTQTDILLCI